MQGDLMRRELLQPVEERRNAGRWLDRLKSHQLVHVGKRAARPSQGAQESGRTASPLVFGPLLANVEGIEIFQAREDENLEQELVDRGSVDVDSHRVRLHQGGTNYISVAHPNTF